MTDETTGGPPGDGSEEPGWAAPGEVSRSPDPGSGGDATAPASPPTAPLPPVADTPSAAWSAPPAPAPPAGPTSAPSRRWLWVLLSVCGLILVIAIAGTVLFVTRTLPPYNGAHDFVSDVIHNRPNAAAAKLCDEDRGDAESALRAIRQKLGFQSGSVSVNPFTVEREGDRATVEYSIDYTHSDRNPTFDLHMRLEHGDWLACPLSG